MMRRQDWLRLWALFCVALSVIVAWGVAYEGLWWWLTPWFCLSAGVEFRRQTVEADRLDGK